MPSKVVRIDIFISSPGDLSEEREIVHRVIERLNRSPLRDQYFLVPLRFEEEVPPEIGKEAQLIVDRYMCVQNSHILIGMFWTRMGTPFTIVETGEQFDSGTQYELLKGYEHCQEHGHPHILLYRKQKENPGADPQQEVKVETFFNRFIGEHPELKGLFAHYSEADRFEDLITEHLRKIIRKYPPDADGHKLVEPPEFQEEERRLDAAMPRQVSLGESTEVRVMVCLPESAGLRAYLPDAAEEPHEIGKEDVREGNLTVAFQKDKESGELQSTPVTVEIDTADFEVRPRQTVQLTPKHDSGMLVFLLKPRRAQERSIVIVRVKTKALDGTEIICGSTSLRTEITATGAQKLAHAIWRMVSLPLGAVSRSNNGALDAPIHERRSSEGFITKNAPRRLASPEEQRRQAIECDLLAAQQIQMRLLPQAPPTLPGFDVAGALFPAHHVSGDYFDYLAMPDGSMGVVIGNATGFGFAPALKMASTRVLLRSLTETHTDVGEILTRANYTLIRETEEERFVTILFVRLDPETGSLVYANAGHPASYVLDRAGKTKARLESTGIPLALLPEAQFAIGGPIILERSDTVVLVTDGIIEASSPAEELFGTERTLEVVCANRDRNASEIVESLFAAIRDFSQRSAPLDDTTAVVIRVTQ